VLNTMLWPDEVRRADFEFLDEDHKIRPQELAMAESLIDSMSGDFKPEEFTDDYRSALQAVIDAKVSGKEVVAPVEAEEAPSGAIDLMAALRASVERARSARDGGGGRSGSATDVAEADDHEPVAPTPISAAKSAKRTSKKAAPAASAAKEAGAGAKTEAKKSTGTKRAPTKKAEPAKKSAEPAKKASKRAAGSTAKSRRSA
jgi:DNA end-binding protein Ku